MMKNAAKMRPPGKALKPSKREIITPAIVAPNIGMSARTKVTAMVTSARLPGIAEKKRLSTKTAAPAKRAPMPEIVSCPVT